jgi:hypothetical protein
MSLLGNVRSRNLARACCLFGLVPEVVAYDPCTWLGPSLPQKWSKNKLGRTNSARTRAISFSIWLKGNNYDMLFNKPDTPWHPHSASPSPPSPPSLYHRPSSPPHVIVSSSVHLPLRMGKEFQSVPSCTPSHLVYLQRTCSCQMFSMRSTDSLEKLLNSFFKEPTPPWKVFHNFSVLILFKDLFLFGKDYVTSLVVVFDVSPSSGVGLTSDNWRQSLVRPDVRPFF